jgi:peptide/nickel transport system substrate-binding protein
VNWWSHGRGRIATTYIFKLRKGVKFHDGSDWNAEVATWNLERLLKHPKSAGKATLDAIDSVTAVDARNDQIEAEVSFSAPSAESQRRYGTVDHGHVVEDSDGEGWARQPLPPTQWVRGLSVSKAGSAMTE